MFASVGAKEGRGQGDNPCALVRRGLPRPGLGQSGDRQRGKVRVSEVPAGVEARPAAVERLSSKLDREARQQR